MEFRHPKYYKELRKRNREVLRSGRGLAVNQAPHVSDQVISSEVALAVKTASASVHLIRASSYKPTSCKQQAGGWAHNPQANL